VVVPGLWTSICFACTVLPAIRDGCEMYGLMDADGDLATAAHTSGIRRMLQAGVISFTAGSLVSE
jgi:nicotinamidase-related amidase